MLKKLECPSCGEAAGVPLLWGTPDESHRKAAACGEAVLAGCMIRPAGGAVPDYACLACAYRWEDEDRK